MAILKAPLEKANIEKIGYKFRSIYWYTIYVPMYLCEVTGAN